MRDISLFLFFNFAKTSAVGKLFAAFVLSTFIYINIMGLLDYVMLIFKSSIVGVMLN